MTSRILITGTRKGIGKALAEAYVERKWQVIGCSRGPGSIEAANYTHHRLDITDEKAVREMLAATRKEFGGLDALVNNAGVALMNHSLLTQTSSFRSVIETNLIATFGLAREAAKLMRRSNYGRIVNFTTVAVPLSIPGEAAYVASKSGVEGLTRVLAHEFGEFGITINAVGPTPVQTDLIDAVPEEKIAALVDKQAIKRMGVFDDILNLVEFLTAPASSFITGQVIYLGGVS